MRKASKSRRSNNGRRKVEDDEFCRNCNRLRHDQEITSLRHNLGFVLDVLDSVLVLARKTSPDVDNIKVGGKTIEELTTQLREAYFG